MKTKKKQKKRKRKNTKYTLLYITRAREKQIYLSFAPILWLHYHIAKFPKRGQLTVVSNADEKRYRNTLIAL